MNSFIPSKFFKILLLFLWMTAAIGCGVDADQRNFEREALRPPSGISEMTSSGVPVEGGERDASDWRIAPEFQGTIEVQTPAYPNPVLFNDWLHIDLNITSFQPVNGLYVFVYRPLTNSLNGPVYSEDRPLNPGLKVITISPQQFAQTGTGTGNLYRLVIYDGSQHIITYGDVRVE